MSFAPTLELLKNDLSDSEQLLCWKYWQIEQSLKRPYYQFVHKVETLATDFGTTRRLLPDLVKSLCKAKITCAGCNEVVELEVRNDFIQLFDYFTRIGNGAIRPARCKKCQAEGKGLPAEGEPVAINSPVLASTIGAPFQFPVVWPLYPDGRIKSEYRYVQHLVAEDRQRWDYFEQLREHYGHVYLQVPISAIIPQKRVDHLLNRSPSYFHPGSFHANRLHFVICNRNLKPVIAVDCLCQEDYKTHFKRTLLTEAQIPYFFLPKDHAFIFSDRINELLEKTAEAEPLYWNREPAGGLDGDGVNGPMAAGFADFPPSEIKSEWLPSYHEKKITEKAAQTPASKSAGEA